MAGHEELGVSEVIEDLKKDVAEAEKARQEGHHQAVEGYYLWWMRELDEPALANFILQQPPRVVLQEAKDLIKAGLAGLGRIHHVDLNSQLVGAEPEQRAPLLRSIHSVNGFYDRLGVSTLPPFSVHGGSIYWPLEIAQDWISTYIKIGELRLALDTITRALVEAKALIKDLRDEGVDLKTPENILKSANYSVFIRRKEFLGILSALGVVEARQGRKDKNLYDILAGLDHMSQAHKYEPNPHRLATLSLWTVDAAKKLDASLPVKSLAFYMGGTMFLRAVIDNRQDAMSALSQMRRERN